MENFSLYIHIYMALNKYFILISYQNLIRKSGALDFAVKLMIKKEKN
jgi:hypothetical protein